MRDKSDHSPDRQWYRFGAVLSLLLATVAADTFSKQGDWQSAVLLTVFVALLGVCLSAPRAGRHSR